MGALETGGWLAIGGAALRGTRLVRVVYVDETGHSAKETVAAVGGLVVDPDRQWNALADKIEALKQFVPDKFRDGFVFRAVDLWHGGKYRHEWADTERRSLLEKLLALPRELEIPLVLGWFEKLKPSPGPNPHVESIMAHSMAHLFCLKAADHFMEKHVGGDEVAMLVAEERKEARNAIRAVHNLVVNRDKMAKWMPEFAAETFFISKIKSPPAFASKDEEPLLQIADACAFAFQRYKKNADGAYALMMAMCGEVGYPLLSKVASAPTNWAALWWISKQQFFESATAP